MFGFLMKYHLPFLYLVTFLVLSQKAYGRIPIVLKLNLTYLYNSEKKIFLKTLRNALFNKEDGKYTLHHTILIDDNLERNIFNHIGNVIFLNS